MTLLSGKSGKEGTWLRTKAQVPQRGEIWRVNLDPTVGVEIKKTRPVVVISSDAMGVLPIRLAAPITAWKDPFAAYLWMVRLDPDPTTGLTKVSVVDTLQLRGLDVQRFVDRMGQVDATTLEEIIAAIAAVIEYPASF